MHKNNLIHGQLNSLTCYLDLTWSVKIAAWHSLHLYEYENPMQIDKLVQFDPEAVESGFFSFLKLNRNVFLFALYHQNLWNFQQRWGFDKATLHRPPITGHDWHEIECLWLLLVRSALAGDLHRSIALFSRVRGGQNEELHGDNQAKIGGLRYSSIFQRMFTSDGFTPLIINYICGTVQRNNHTCTWAKFFWEGGPVGNIYQKSG